MGFKVLRLRTVLGMALGLGVVGAIFGLWWTLRAGAGDDHAVAIRGERVTAAEPGAVVEHTAATPAAPTPPMRVATPPTAPGSGPAKPPAALAEGDDEMAAADPTPSPPPPTPPPPGVDPDRLWMDGVIDRFRRGQEAYRDGRWAEAAEMALSIHDDIGGAQNLYYAADCYDRLGDTARAQELRARYADELQAEKTAKTQP